MTHPMHRFASQLVQTRSLSGEEGAIIELIASEMKRLAFDEVRIDAVGNVHGLIQGETKGQTLLLDAHCDTVGVPTESGWTRDPFDGAIADGALHGRGSADMKGALAAMVYAAAATDRRRLAGRVVVCASVLEEVMEGLALRAVIDALEPDFVVVGEASDLQLIHGGRGRAEIHLETIGKPAHTSSPQAGRNAVSLMIPILAELEALPPPSHPRLGEGILALADIISDPYPGHSVIPSRCRATFDRRLLIGETQESVLGQLRNLPSLARTPHRLEIGAGSYRSHTGVEIAGPKFFPAWLLDEDHPLLQRARSGMEGAGLKANLSTYRFCTNAAYSAGRAGIPTIGFGPGREEDAHVANEWVQLAELDAAQRGYSAIISSVLGRTG